MNRQDFDQVGGFPFSTKMLAEMQRAYATLQAFGEVVGNLSIISGCEVTGGSVSDGFVFINGELYEFRGGTAQTKVIIREEVEYGTFEDGNTKPIFRTRYATFGTGIEFHLWADFKRGYPTKNLADELEAKAPMSALETINARLALLEAKSSPIAVAGTMMFWRKPANQIPPGWQEVVDWRGRMPVGFKPGDADFGTLGDTGGGKQAALTAANNGPHNHTISINTNAAGSGYFAFEGESGATQTPHEFTSSESGEGEPFSILNPYRVVMFIEWVGLPE